MFRPVSVAVLVALVLSACSTTEEIIPAPTSPPPVVPTSAPAPATTEPPSPTVTAAPATTSPATTAPPATTVPATTSPPPSTVTPTTAVPISVQELVLGRNGLGEMTFGTDADTVVDYVTSILGSPTDDSGWVDPFAFGVCPGTTTRRVEWGVLSLLFSDQSRYADGPRHLMWFVYGVDGEIGEEPSGLRTPGGVGLGSTVESLLAEFPDAVVYPEDPDVGQPAGFYVDDTFSGFLTGDQPSDVLTVLFVGQGCGE